jgi:DNA-binding NarL/FixJ family response regulator
MSFRILIVDDDPVVRRLVRSSIEQITEWSVCGEAENGQLALDAVRNSNPNAVILDLQMPVMNGLETARQISQIAPETAMAMLTLHDSEHLEREALKVGIERVFAKFQLPQLVAWLKTTAEKSAKRSNVITV